MTLRRLTIALLTVCSVANTVYHWLPARYLTPLVTLTGFSFAGLPWVVAGWMTTGSAP